MLRQCSLAILLFVVHVLASANEYFDENLYIKPLSDGKVYTHFKFKTLLENAVPRLPHSLGQRDKRMSLLFVFLNVFFNVTSSALCRVSFNIRSDSSPICSNGASPLS